MEESVVQQYVKDPDNMRRFLKAHAAIGVADELDRAICQEGIKPRELARRCGRSKRWVKQLLNGDGDPTLEQIADVFAVMGREIHITSMPMRV